MVEHRSPKPGAGGSSPSTPANFNNLFFDLKKKFTELIFFEENDSMICEAGLWYYLSDESILTNTKKKSKKVGFFESFFNIFSK